MNNTIILECIKSLIKEMYQHLDNNTILDRAFIIEILEAMTESINQSNKA